MRLIPALLLLLLAVPMVHGAEPARVEQSLFVYTERVPVTNAFVELCAFQITPPAQSTDGCCPYEEGETSVHLELLTEMGLPTKAPWEARTHDDQELIEYGMHCGSGHTLSLPDEGRVLRLRFRPVPLGCGNIPVGTANAAILVEAMFT